MGKNRVVISFRALSCVQVCRGLHSSFLSISSRLVCSSVLKIGSSGWFSEEAYVHVALIPYPPEALHCRGLSGPAAMAGRGTHDAFMWLGIAAPSKRCDCLKIPPSTAPQSPRIFITTHSGGINRIPRVPRPSWMGRMGRGETEEEDDEDEEEDEKIPPRP